jgi:hypothetical protein
MAAMFTHGPLQSCRMLNGDLLVLHNADVAVETLTSLRNAMYDQHYHIC